MKISRFIKTIFMADFIQGLVIAIKKIVGNEKTRCLNLLIKSVLFPTSSNKVL